MLTRIIVLLLRLKLGVRTYEPFTFTNQKTSSVYWFSPTEIMKSEKGVIRQSNVRLNWLLSKDCKIKVVFER